MVYGVFLAGGTGSRMKSTMPKQFIKVNGKPIFMYSLETIVRSKLVDNIIVVCNTNYIDYMDNIIKKSNIHSNNIFICDGGNSRLNSIIKGTNYVENNFSIGDKDIIIVFDSARPMINNELIEKNIEFVIKYGVSHTLAKLENNAILLNEDGTIKELLSRDILYEGQSPQAFNIKLFEECIKDLTEEERKNISDVSIVFLKNNIKVLSVPGYKENIKITTATDIQIFKNLLRIKK